MVKLLWARHGENVANLTGTLSYRVFDGDLTELGNRQAAELAERLAASSADPVRLLACSPLRRARQTAQIISAGLGLPDALELDDLREHGRDHRHVRAFRNLYINGIETSGLKLGDSGLRLSAVKRSIHGTGAGDQRNPLESLGRIVHVAETT